MMFDVCVKSVFPGVFVHSNQQLEMHLKSARLIEIELEVGTIFRIKHDSFHTKISWSI